MATKHLAKFDDGSVVWEQQQSRYSSWRDDNGDGRCWSVGDRRLWSTDRHKHLHGPPHPLHSLSRHCHGAMRSSLVEWMIWRRAAAAVSVINGGVQSLGGRSWPHIQSVASSRTRSRIQSFYRRRRWRQATATWVVCARAAGLAGIECTAQQRRRFHLGARSWTRQQSWLCTRSRRVDCDVKTGLV